jgi:hypothetical protein
MMLGAPLVLFMLASVSQATELDDVGHELVLLQQEISLGSIIRRHDKQQPLDGQDEGCKRDDRNWLFILGAGRSGSTSILEMVNAIPGYFLGGENGGIMSEFLGLWRKREDQKTHANYLSWAPAGETSDQNHLCAMQAYVRAIIGSPAVGEPTPTTLGFKEIRHTEKEELDMFQKIFPNAKFIINIRNAFEQARSQGRMLPAKANMSEGLLEKNITGQNKQLIEWGRNHSNISFLLPMEEFSLPRFNELLDFLGVENCRYTHVAHANSENGDTSNGYTHSIVRDPSTLAGIECV